MVRSLGPTRSKARRVDSNAVILRRLPDRLQTVVRRQNRLPYTVMQLAIGGDCVLFRQRFLDGIARGQVTLAFRRWRRPTVKAGGTLQTPAGLLQIRSVDVVHDKQIKSAEARAAGFEGLPELLADIASQRDGVLYRIRFRRIGDDPRNALRAKATLSGPELEALRKRLARLDRREAWTLYTLRAISANPAMRAADLATKLGRAKDELKVDVRKLKNLGLTESLGTGYRISPLGLAWLAQAKG